MPDAEGLRDDPAPQTITASETIFAGAVWDVRRESFDYSGTSIARECVDHPGAVAILAQDDDARLANQERLRSFVVEHRDVAVFSAHDPTEYAALTT